MKTLLDSLRINFIRHRRKNENKSLIALLDKYVHRDSSILDVGCGVGDNIALLKKNGFLNITGTDISDSMLNISKSKGYKVSRYEELENNKKFDVILFSHVLEHIDYSHIQKMMESYFKLCKINSIVVICMPLLNDMFYNDVDHIKPYYPKGLTSLFSNENISKSYHSNYELNLIDIRYLRVSLIPYHLRCRHIRTVPNYMLLCFLTVIFLIFQKITFGLASKVTSYIAIFSLGKPSE